MLSTENAVIEILPGSANDSTAAEVYRNLQVLYATRAGPNSFVNSRPQEAPAIRPGPRCCFGRGRGGAYRVSPVQVSRPSSQA